MGLLSAVRDFFSRTEITEETFEYESIDSYLSKQKEEGEQPQDDVAFKCDQIVDATYQMEDLRIEYDMVTSYFEDIQLIEDLPASAHKEIVDIAKKIAFLESETTQFLQSDDRISDENFRMMQGIEDNLSDIFAQLKSLEDMQLKIKRDMKHLEAEKESLEYLQDSIDERQMRLRTFITGFGIVGALSVLTLALIGVLSGNNLILPILLILLVVAGVAAMSIIVYRKLSYEFKLSELKENRAINLMNRVKIKYINNTSTLEYLYQKYNIKSLRDLEYLYSQYVIMVDEVRRFQQSSGDLREFNDKLSKLLFSYGVKDPDVWMKQSIALIDHREMVEVKHALNVRRQKLREQIAYNEELRLNGLKDIKEMLRNDPSLREQVKRELELYHIQVEN